MLGNSPYRQFQNAVPSNPCSCSYSAACTFSHRQCGLQPQTPPFPGHRGDPTGTHLLWEVWVFHLYVPVLFPSEDTFTHGWQNSSCHGIWWFWLAKAEVLMSLGDFWQCMKGFWKLVFVLLGLSLTNFTLTILHILMPLLCIFSSSIPLNFQSLNIIIPRLV